LSFSTIPQIKFVESGRFRKQVCLEVATPLLPSQKGAVKSNALAKRTAGNDSSHRAESKSFGEIRIGPYTDKSYFQKKVGSQWKSSINISGLAQEVHNKIAWNFSFFFCKATRQPKMNAQKSEMSTMKH